jgi:excisionase family DNA binding protein
VTKQDPQHNSRLLRCAQAAHYLGTGKKRILELIAKGELPYVQLSDHANSPFLIDMRDLDRLVEARKTRV